MDKILRQPMLLDLHLETAVDYSIEFIRLLGSPKMFIDKVDDVIIELHRGVIPCDVIEINQVRGEHNEEFISSSDTFYPDEYEKERFLANTYKIQGLIIFTSLENGKILVSYKTVAVDDDGFPMIPDDLSFMKALENYIKVLWFTNLFDLGKINMNVLIHAEKEYAWYVGQAHNSLIKPSLDEMEVLTNILSRMLPDRTQHKKNYTTLGQREYIKRH